MTRTGRFLQQCCVCVVITWALFAAGVTNQARGATNPDLSPPPDGKSPDVSGVPSLSVITEKVQAYPGEAIPVTIKLEYAANLAVRDIQYPRILHPGLSLREAGPPTQGMEQKSGISWSTLEFRYLMSGARAGEFILGPVSLTCSLLRPDTTTDSQGFFGDAEPRRLNLTAQGGALTILPFPTEGKPGDFSGAVGDFRIAVTVKPREVGVGDPVTVTTTISGEGAMETVACPAAGEPGGLKGYKPQASRMKGETVCEQILTPADESIRQIPPVAFSFFDPRRGVYRTVRQGPFPLTVIAASGPKKVALSPPPIPAISGDAVARQTVAGHVPGIRICLIVICTIALLTLPVYLFRQFRKRTKLSSPEEALEIMPRESPPEPSLDMVEARLADSQSGPFHTEVFRTMQLCLGNHCKISPQSITADIVESHLRPEGCSDLVIDMVQTLFGECDRARYGDTQVSKAEMEATCRSLKELLRCLETSRSSINNYCDFA